MSACSSASTCRRTPSPARIRSMLSAKGPSEPGRAAAHPHRGQRDAGQAQPQVAPAVAARHAALLVRLYGDGQQRQRQGPHRGAVGPGAGQLPDHLHRGLRLQRDQLDPDRGRPDQGHQGQGDAAARRQGGRLSGAGQGRVGRRHGRAARHAADQRPGQARALDQGRAPVGRGRGRQGVRPTRWWSPTTARRRSRTSRCRARCRPTGRSSSAPRPSPASRPTRRRKSRSW